MPLEAPAGFSPAAAELLEALLHSHAPPHPAAAPFPAIPEVAAYLCGCLPDEAAGRLERALTRSRTARSLLRETRRRLDALAAKSWAEVGQEAAGAGPEAETARAWLELLQRQSAGVDEVVKHRFRWHWTRIRDGLGQGAAEAIAAWSAIRTAAAVAAAPGTPRLALARHGEPRDRGEATGFDIASAQVESSGDLVVVATVVREPEQQPAKELKVDLEMGSGPDVWPLAVAPVRAGRVEWRCPGLGRALGMPEGPVDTALFSIPVTGSPRERLINLRVQVLPGSSGGAPSGVVLPLREPPHWSRGRALLNFAASPELDSLARSHSLRLFLTVAPECEQLLGEWSAGQWPSAEGQLESPCPGCPSGCIAPVFLRAEARPAPSPA